MVSKVGTYTKPQFRGRRKDVGCGHCGAVAQRNLACFQGCYPSRQKCRIGCWNGIRNGRSGRLSDSFMEMVAEKKKEEACDTRVEIHLDVVDC